jgi:tetratricopeptide (TPR) repeat protein
MISCPRSDTVHLFDLNPQNSTFHCIVKSLDILDFPTDLAFNSNATAGYCVSYFGQRVDVIAIWYKEGLLPTVEQICAILESVVENEDLSPWQEWILKNILKKLEGRNGAIEHLKKGNLQDALKRIKQAVNLMNIVAEDINTVDLDKLADELVSASLDEVYGFISNMELNSDISRKKIEMAWKEYNLALEAYEEKNYTKALKHLEKAVKLL